MKAKLKQLKLPMPLTLDQFQKDLGVTFKNKELLRQAFIHRSYINEAGNPQLAHNERLEFLGDAVLELVVTEYLYKNFTNPEGELTNWRSSIVKGEVLAQVAARLSLGELLFLSRGEEKSGGRERSLILANTFEALVGALYLDHGYDVAAKFISANVIALLPDIIANKLYVDPKSHLQELSQEKFSATPEYRVHQEDGPDHSKVFVVGVYAKTKLLAEGSGPSKQKAEQDAAAKALTELQKTN